MRALYEIANDLAQLLTTDDGELPGDLEQQLDALAIQFDTKVENCCYAIRNLEAEEQMLKVEAERFEKRAQTAKRQRDRLRAYVMMNLEKLGMDKLECGIFKVRIQANGVPSVTFEGNPADLPGEYQRITIELLPAAAIKAYNAGEELPLGVSVQKGHHLRIS